MQVVVEKVSQVERRLTIQVPVDDLTKAIEKEINYLAKNANLSGFRKGKVPVHFIRQQFGSEARMKGIESVIKQSLYEALTEHKLQPIDPPSVEPKEFTPDKPLEFVASFEVLPEIAEVKFNLEKVEKPVVEIRDEDINRVIEQLSKQQTKWNVVDRAATDKDRVVIDYYAIFEGKSDEENKVQGYPLELGSKRMIAGFEEGLIGAKAGDERRLNLTFPKDLKDDTKAGKPVEFVIQVKQVFEADVPEISEAFIKQVGIESGKEEDLKAQITKTLNQEKSRLIQEKIKEQVFEGLVAQNDIEVPQSLIKREAQKLHDDIYQGKHDHNHSDEEWAQFESIGKKRVILGLLVSEYAKQMKITPNKEKVKEKIAEIAQFYEKPEEIISYLSNREHSANLESQVLEDQVIEKLLEKTEQVEKNLSYAELKGINQ